MKKSLSIAIVLLGTTLFAAPKVKIHTVIAPVEWANAELVFENQSTAVITPYQQEPIRIRINRCSGQVALDNGKKLELEPGEISFIYIHKRDKTTLQCTGTIISDASESQDE